MKKKKMTLNEFNKFITESMRPIQVNNADMPSWAKNIPKNKIYSVFASGSLNVPQNKQNKAGQIGGIDIFRNAEPKDGVKLNKDHYYVVQDPKSSNQLFVFGPYREDPNSPTKEHHINDLPKRLKKAIIS